MELIATKEKLDQFDSALADVLCFIQGVKFAETITQDCRLTDLIRFIDVKTLKELKVYLKG